MFHIELSIATKVCMYVVMYIFMYVHVHMHALPVAQPVAADGACFVHLPSLPLSVEQTEALKITLLLVVHKTIVPEIFCNLLFQLNLLSGKNLYLQNFIYTFILLISVK